MGVKPVKSVFWDTHDAALGFLARIAQNERESYVRSTVVVPIIDYAKRPLVVRHNNPEKNWGLIQGKIEPGDPHPSAAGLREAYEEGFVTIEKVEAMFPYLGDARVMYPKRSFDTGYSLGAEYFYVGIQLKQGADVSVVPPPRFPQALLERRWCSSLDQAIAILREQPGVKQALPTTLQKVEQVLIPALESVYQPQAQELLELFDHMK